MNKENYLQFIQWEDAAFKCATEIVKQKNKRAFVEIIDYFPDRVKIHGKLHDQEGNETFQIEISADEFISQIK